MIISTGVDSVSIARIHDLWQRSGERFLARVFTESERLYCLSRHRPAESLAARFCAKEAVLKCLGTGYAHGVGFRQIEVARQDGGAVEIALRGRAAQVAAARGIRRLHLSLTHTDDTATAFVVAEQ
jgi:holo-[acyl-carrier protein] synthase